MGSGTSAARLLAVVTALMIVAPSARAVAASLDQLVAIDQMLSARDWGALWSFVMANPDLMQGEDPLAVELRAFARSMNLGTMDEFAARSFVADRSRSEPY